MRIALLSAGDGWHVRDLMRAAADLGHVAEPVDFRQVFAGVGIVASASPDAPTLDDFGAVIVRTMPPGSLEQVVFRMDSLHALADRGVPVLNPPRALEVCDKHPPFIAWRGRAARPETMSARADAASKPSSNRPGCCGRSGLRSEGRGMVA